MLKSVLYFITYKELSADIELITTLYHFQLDQNVLVLVRYQHFMARFIILLDSTIFL